MVKIIGAGMAGLLAARMLKRMDPVVFEQQQSLPNNHSAVLRFRSDAIGKVLDIEFKKVSMIKSELPWRNPVAAALAYSDKVIGEYRSDRSIKSGLVEDVRWVAPANLITRMAEGVKINYGVDGFKEELSNAIISTVPMPVLMNQLDYHNKPKFKFSSGSNIHAQVRDCEAYVSLLVPDPNYKFSRISLTGDDLAIECTEVISNEDTAWNIAEEAADLLGIEMGRLSNVSCHRQRYAKIAPIDDEVRRDFMFWATNRFEIYSLGRFATWRPGLLLDDLVKDISRIQHWITRQDKYGVALQS